MAGAGFPSQQCVRMTFKSIGLLCAGLGQEGGTASLLIYASGKVKRAAIVYEGPKAPGPAGFGASIDFLDCN